MKLRIGGILKIATNVIVHFAAPAFGQVICYPIYIPIWKISDQVGLKCISHRSSIQHLSDNNLGSGKQQILLK